MKCVSLIATLVLWLQAAHGQSTIAYFNGPSFPVPAFYGYSKGIDFDGDGVPEFSFWSGGNLCTLEAV